MNFPIGSVFLQISLLISGIRVLSINNCKGLGFFKLFFKHLFIKLLHKKYRIFKYIFYFPCIEHVLIFTQLSDSSRNTVWKKNAIFNIKIGRTLTLRYFRINSGLLQLFLFLIFQKCCRMLRKVHTNILNKHHSAKRYYYT